MSSPNINADTVFINHTKGVKSNKLFDAITWHDAGDVVFCLKGGHLVDWIAEDVLI